MSITVTNIVESHAQRGKYVIVTLGSTDTISKLPTLSKGQKCTLGSSAKVGYIYSIDTFGRTFIMNPIHPIDYIDSLSTPGMLAKSEVITII